MSCESIEELIAAVRREADAAEFPIDEPVYVAPAATRRTRSCSPGRWRRRSASSAATWARTRSPPASR